MSVCVNPANSRLLLPLTLSHGGQQLVGISGAFREVRINGVLAIRAPEIINRAQFDGLIEVILAFERDLREPIAAVLGGRGVRYFGVHHLLIGARLYRLSEPACHIF